MPPTTPAAYAAQKGWAAIDTLRGFSRASKTAVQKRKLRDRCTLFDVNGEIIPFEGCKGELVEGKLVENAFGTMVWVPDCRKVLRNEMKHADSLTGAGGVLSVLLSWGVVAIEEHEDPTEA